MKTPEILTIIALSVLGLGLLSGLAGGASKNAKTKEKLNQICSLLFFLAVVLIAVGQLLTEDGFKLDPCPPCTTDDDCKMWGAGTCQDDCCILMNNSALTSVPCMSPCDPKDSRACEVLRSYKCCETESGGCCVPKTQKCPYLSTKE